MIMKTQNLWNAVKALLRWKYQVLNVYVGKEKKTKINDGNIYLKKP